VKKKWKIKILVALALLVGALSFLLVLKKQGYFEDPAIALRELEKREIPATAARAREASAKGEQEILDLLGRAGVDFTEPDENGKSPLHLALEADNHQSLALFDKYGASVNEPDKGGRVPLWYALEKEDATMAAWLTERDADVNFKVGQEAAVISYYDTRRWDDLGFLLDSSAEVNVKGSDGETLLSRAIRDGNTPWVKRFLHAGAQPNGTFANGEHLLSKALHMGRADLVIDLLESGANPNTKTPSGESILHETLSKRTELGIAEDDATRIVNTMMAKKADIESPNKEGLRPLQSALEHQFLGAQNLLLPKAQDISNSMNIAMKHNNFEAMKTLLDRGASADEIVNGETPLFAMIKSGNVEMVTKLISSGASLEVLGKEGQRPLVTAIAAGQPDVALAMLSHERSPQLDAHMEAPVSEEFRELFAKKGLFDWYCRNETELEPIHAAVMRRQLHVAERLLALETDRFASTKKGVYPIQMAAANGDIKMQQLLIGVSYDDDKQVRNFIIDLSEQKVYYYSEGELKKTSRISSGQSGFRTTPGNYVITDKTKKKVSNIYKGADMPYFQRFSCSAIGFHEGYTGSRFASHGCIRLPMSTAKYFWGETQLGDRVTIRK